MAGCFSIETIEPTESIISNNPEGENRTLENFNAALSTKIKFEELASLEKKRNLKEMALNLESEARCSFGDYQRNSTFDEDSSESSLHIDITDIKRKALELTRSISQSGNNISRKNVSPTTSSSENESDEITGSFSPIPTQITIKEARDAYDLQCQICQINYKNPKVLPCLHSFCHTCLEDTIK